MPVMAESKGQVFVDEQEIILLFYYFIIIAIWSRSVDYSRNYSTLRGAGMFPCSQPLPLL